VDEVTQTEMLVSVEGISEWFRKFLFELQLSSAKMTAWRKNKNAGAGTS
jgi:hypothetical protein